MREDMKKDTSLSVLSNLFVYLVSLKGSHSCMSIKYP